MTSDTFFDNFAFLADAPNGVQKLREMILQLAVRGDLAPNNPEDEPVRLNISGNSSSNLLPSNWRSGILGDAITLEYGENLPATKRSGSGEYPVYGSNGIVGTHDTFLIKEPAIIVGRKGSAGALNIANSPSWTTDVAYFVRPPSELDLRFTYYLLSALRLEDLCKGIKPGLSRKEAYDLSIAIPPFAEQHRIVAKVDHLMAFCDELEVKQQQRSEARERLSNALIDKLLAAREPAEFDEHWQRLCDHFDLLYNTPDTIGKLRQAILQLAVQGKLVPQDPEDEPASVLIDRIRTVREKTSAKRTREEKSSLQLVERNDVPFELPKEWAFARFSELGEFGRGKSRHRPRNDPKLYTDGKYPLVQTGDVARANGVIHTHTGLYNEIGLAQSRLWPEGTLCITIAANIADSSLLGFPACIPDSVVGFIPSEEIGDAICSVHQDVEWGGKTYNRDGSGLVLRKEQRC